MGTVARRGATRAPRQSWRQLRMGAPAAVLVGLCLAGCAAGPQGPMAAASVQGPTIAFESIDGPPESIFRKYVDNLNEEAATRQLAVVSRAAPAQYRVRGYLSALVGKGRATVIAWVWDVYDADESRVMRISGEEAASSSGRGTWASADDRVLRRIATSGMQQLAAYLAAPATASPAAPPSMPVERGPNIAAADTAPPEARAWAPAATTALAAMASDR